MAITSKSRRHARENRTFFLTILAALVLSTMFSGGTALVIASNMMKGQAIELAEAVPLSTFR